VKIIEMFEDFNEKIWERDREELTIAMRCWSWSERESVKRNLIEASRMEEIEEKQVADSL